MWAAIQTFGDPMRLFMHDTNKCAFDIHKSVIKVLGAISCRILEIK
jgi:hypothetical protein